MRQTLDRSRFENQYRFITFSFIRVLVTQNCMKVDFTHTTSRVQSPKLSTWQVLSLSQDQTTKTAVFVRKGYFKYTFILDDSHLSASLTSGRFNLSLTRLPHKSNI